MASETRKIVFTFPELRRAIAIFGKKTERAFPQGNVKSLKVSGAGRDQTFLMEVVADDLVDHAALRMNRGDMLTALLLMCRLDGVPVPRSGEKVLKTDAEGLIMYMKTEMSVQHTLNTLEQN